MRKTFNWFAVSLFVVGCYSSASSKNDADSDTTASNTDSQTDSDSGTDSDSVADTDSGLDTNTETDTSMPPAMCPHVDFGRTNSFSYSGSTEGLPDWVESESLEWGDAPDDTILFTVSEGSDYSIFFQINTVSNTDIDCMAVVEKLSDAPFETGLCPVPGESALILHSNDTLFDQWMPDDRIMTWVSCSTNSSVNTTSYRLNISMFDYMK